MRPITGPADGGAQPSDPAQPPDPARSESGRPAGGPDRTTRVAVLWATAVAVPLTVVVALFALYALDGGAATPGPAPTTARVQATTPVPMAAPALGERGAVVCRALLAKLPATIRGLGQRPVTAGRAQNSAYGDPAVTVACGVPAQAVTATELIYVMNQVCWSVAEAADATLWTTVDREVSVRVTVPRPYEQPGQWANEFSAPILASIPLAKSVPSGCGG